MSIQKPKAGGIEATMGVCHWSWFEPEKVCHVLCKGLGDTGIVH